jgi:Bacteriophage HK97-gp10, putative tail-component
LIVADGIEINITGISDAVRSLSDYSHQMADVVAVRAVKLGADVMRKAAKNQAPVSRTGKFPGRLKRSIIARKSKIHSRQRDGLVGYYVVAKKKGKTDNPNNGYYAPWIQKGWEVRGRSLNRGSRRIGSGGLRSGRKTAPSGRFVAPNAFMDRAFLANRAATEQLINTAIERGSSEMVSRLGL